LNFSFNIQEWVTGLIHIFFPEICVICEVALVKNEKVICSLCSYKLPQTEYTDFNNNLSAQRFLGRVSFLNIDSFLYFTKDGIVQKLLHELKYYGKKEIGYELGVRFAKNIYRYNWYKDVDYIVPVPLHKKRENERGYNQALIIAQGMADILHIPVQHKVLKRVVNTPSQTKKSRQDRLINLENAFLIRNKSYFENKHILLVDDVMTTGATIECCIKQLNNCKNIKISIATLAVVVD
jgi:competence protein ComFC